MLMIYLYLGSFCYMDSEYWFRQFSFRVFDKRFRGIGFIFSFIYLYNYFFEINVYLIFFIVNKRLNFFKYCVYD